ncbi:MAG: alpha-L-rhamnosidase N-terminal domain-containing protein, partial [Alistipes sp.]|nr:alpha-L-rhamnosidase N-terminal domain-containing protein [Alistipes sp.]
MNWITLLHRYGLLALLMWSCSALYGQKTVSVDQLKCEQQAAPLGIDTPTPRFSWQLRSAARDVHQTAYQILVADSPEALGRSDGNMWDSRKVLSSASLLIPYAGKTLEAGKTYYWSVRVWDASRRFSAWSCPAQFTMGLLSEADWSGARWIALESDVDSLIVTDGMARHLPKIGDYKLPQLRKSFSLSKPIDRALAFVCGLGQFELYINGTKSGDHFLDPAWTKFDKNVQYVTFDITPQVVQGD